MPAANGAKAAPTIFDGSLPPLVSISNLFLKFKLNSFSFSAIKNHSLYLFDVTFNAISRVYTKKPRESACVMLGSDVVSIVSKRSGNHQTEVFSTA